VPAARAAGHDEDEIAVGDLQVRSRLVDVHAAPALKERGGGEKAPALLQ
jgi:hypothetical protein